MVVIAIIIILAAIAIPNYLTMTARAKKSRVASDFAALATALETFNTDWGVYPVQASYLPLTDVATHFAYGELTGTALALINKVGGNTGGITAAGDVAPIVYMTSNILGSMKNPYNAANSYQYASSTTGLHWGLWASESKGTPAATDKYWSRTDASTSLTEGTGAAAPGIPAEP